MAEFSLHCFVESGNAYKAALMLQLCAADWEAKWVDFFKGGHRTPEYRTLNELSEVPVLEHHRPTGETLILSQSGVILTYLAKEFGRYGPRDSDEEREIMRWILFDNHKLTGNIATWRFMRKFMNKADAPETKFMEGRAMNAIKTLERRLANRDWVAANHPTIADISICGYLFWPDDIGLDWDDYPNIKAWLGRMRGLENWAAPETILPSGPSKSEMRD